MTSLFGVLLDFSLFAQVRQPNPGMDAANASAAMGCMACYFGGMTLFIVVIIASMWKLFTKAGQPGWVAIIPIYNNYILTVKIAKLEILWFILQFVPLINIVAAYMVWAAVARKFGKSEVYAIGLLLLPFIFVPMLAFGDAKYKKGLDFNRDDEYEY